MWWYIKNMPVILGTTPESNVGVEQTLIDAPIAAAE